MRTLISLALVASAWTLGGCLDAESSLTGPSSGGSLGRAAIAWGSELRIVEPQSGATLVDGEPYLVIAQQEVRDGPLQGRARLQHRTENGDWTSAGPDFPWERRQQEIITDCEGCKGDWAIRLIVFEDRPEDPFLVSQVVRVHAMQRRQVNIDSK